MFRKCAPGAWLEKKLPGLLFGLFGAPEVMRTWTSTAVMAGRARKLGKAGLYAGAVGL
jgi:hypothetical protein